MSRHAYAAYTAGVTAAAAVAAVVALSVAPVIALAAGAPPSLRAAFATRAAATLANASSDSNPDHGAFSELARLALGRGNVTGSGMYEGLAKMAAREDCSDFDVSTICRMLLLHGDSPLMPPQLKADLTAALLGWQYWIDEANGFQGNMEFFTENHQMSFHSSEYLAGALLRHEVFPGTNMSGAQHYAKGRAFVLQWLERRYRWGESEWKSEVYTQFDVTNLANLVAAAPDADIRTRAAMVLDLILLDLSLHNHDGMIASSRGRSYGPDKFSIMTSSIHPLVWMLSNQGFPSAGVHGPSVVVALNHLQASIDYEVPDVVLDVAADFGAPERIIREDISISPYDIGHANQTGLGYTSPDDGMVWWGMEAFASPLTVQLAFTMGDSWSLWGSNETTWVPFGYLRPLAKVPGLVQLIALLISPVMDGPVLGPASSYTFRTPDAMLSSVLDYNKGGLGTQQHAWQATLNGTTPVFTTWPGPNLQLMRDSAARVSRAASKEWRSQVPAAALRGNDAATATPPPRSLLDVALQHAPDGVAEDFEALLSQYAGDVSRSDVAAAMEQFVSSAMTAMREGAGRDAVAARQWGGRGTSGAASAVVNGVAPYNCSGESSHDKDYADGCWSGSASLPRVAQHRDVLIALYNAPWGGFPDFLFPPRTHAFFPKGQFDEYADHLSAHGWALGRQGDGYVALYTNSRNVTWLPVPGHGGAYEILARHSAAVAKAVWICVVGRAAHHGSFANFSARVLGATVTTNTSAGPTVSATIAFADGASYSYSWDKPFVVDLPGLAGPLQPSQSGFGRYDNPYAHVAFAASRIDIQHGAHALSMDWDAGTRALVQPGGEQPASHVADVAARAASRIVAQLNNSGWFGPNLGNWDYEGGVVQCGLWELASAFPSDARFAALLPAASERLDYFATTPGQFGADILSGTRIPVPWIYSVGDRVGLYPIGYAARVRHHTATAAAAAASGAYDNATDLRLLRGVIDEYIETYPHHLVDGTLSRPIDWLAEGFISWDSRAVWADDSFMGTAVQSMNAALTGNATDANEAMRQALLVSQHLVAGNGLYWHGLNNDTGDFSCCKWGRGNGWALVAKVEALAAAAAVRSACSAATRTDVPVASAPECALDTATESSLLAEFKAHAAALLRVQDASDGRWRNVLDQQTSFHETSVTAMVLYAYCEGMRHGWLMPADGFSAAATKAWAALAASVDDDGYVSGVVGETSIHDTAGQYDAGGASTAYEGSAPGIGAVLRAAAAYARWSGVAAGV